MKIRIAGTANDSIVDGPGIRFTVFTQGCPHRCKDCHNPQTHDFNGGRTADTDQIINMIKENNKYITDGADEMQVLSEWKMSNFIMPPPTRVTEIKNTYEKLSWTQFIELVKKLCN